MCGRMNEHRNTLSVGCALGAVSHLTVYRKMKVLRTNSAQSSVIDTAAEEGRHSQRKTNLCLRHKLVLSSTVTSQYIVFVPMCSLSCTTFPCWSNSLSCLVADLVEMCRVSNLSNNSTTSCNLDEVLGLKLIHCNKTELHGTEICDFTAARGCCSLC